ncbi:MAG: hypothetical protein AB2531_00535, partial [Candidatus Thiodiazotropha sp.]
MEMHREKLAGYYLSLLLSIVLLGCGGGSSDSDGQASGVVEQQGLSLDGYNLFASLDSTTTYLMDNEGSVVHSWASDYPPGNAVYLLQAGELLHTGNIGNSRFDAGGAGGVVQT